MSTTQPPIPAAPTGFFHRISAAVHNWFASWNPAQAIQSSLNWLKSFDLTPEHIGRIHDEIVAVKDAINPSTGAPLESWEKAIKVADAIDGLGSDFALPQAASDNLHTIISVIHTADKLHALLK